MSLPLFLPAALAVVLCADRPADPAPRTRTFQFTYAAAVTGLKPDQAARDLAAGRPVERRPGAAIVSKDLPGRGQDRP